MKKSILKFLPLIIIYLIFVIYSIYGIQVRQKKIYDEYNNMEGEVLSVFKSNTCNFITVKLNNGIVGSVNAGYSNYLVGDKFINEVRYNKFTGMDGYASFIIPNKILCVCNTIILFVFVLFPTFLLILYFVIVGFVCWYNMIEKR